MALINQFTKVTSLTFPPYGDLPGCEYPIYVSGDTWKELQDYPLKMSELSLTEYIIYNFNDLEKNQTFDIDRVQNLASQAHYAPIPVRLLPNNVIAVGQDTIDWFEQNPAAPASLTPPAPQ